MLTWRKDWGWVLGLTVLLLSSDQALTDSDGLVSVGESFLNFYSELMTFPAAVATCAKIGAHLANDDDPLMHAYLRKNGVMRASCDIQGVSH